MASGVQAHQALKYRVTKAQNLPDPWQRIHISVFSIIWSRGNTNVHLKRDRSLVRKICHCLRPLERRLADREWGL